MHTSVASAHVFVNGTRVGRVETELTVPCGKRFVAIGMPTRKERPPVWLAPGRNVEIACGGPTELTIAPHPMK